MSTTPFASLGGPSENPENRPDHSPGTALGIFGVSGKGKCEPPPGFFPVRCVRLVTAGKVWWVPLRSTHPTFL
ncbi:Uncharacterized protein dnm_029350 [Desulfonema magnum]|uniref:Uncharacterized protein n=1 Tax=Desulfonema magnum TaxID=45655 RepID=A0A975GMM9_9BACT|nr:Uncharacterized protein dnm_029350 [Desulfonema magnum]